MLWQTGARAAKPLKCISVEFVDSDFVVAM